MRRIRMYIWNCTRNINNTTYFIYLLARCLLCETFPCCPEGYQEKARHFLIKSSSSGHKIIIMILKPFSDAMVLYCPKKLGKKLF